MVDSEEHYERLVIKLIYQHGHENAKKRRKLVKKWLVNGLDYPDVDEVIEDAANDLPFIECNKKYVWYLQNEEMLIYVRDETSVDLGIIGSNFSHLTPPALREKYNLPPPNY